MQQEIATPVDLKVLMNHIYEYKKGVRRLVLYTFNKKYESFAITRLERQNIDYIIQPVGNDRLNLFFGKKALPLQPEKRNRYEKRIRKNQKD